MIKLPNKVKPEQVLAVLAYPKVGLIGLRTKSDDEYCKTVHFDGRVDKTWTAMITMHHPLLEDYFDRGKNGAGLVISVDWENLQDEDLTKFRI